MFYFPVVFSENPSESHYPNRSKRQPPLNHQSEERKRKRLHLYFGALVAREINRAELRR
ncbi:hypothetical protein BofuT4_uP006230.1 [Botrytis cinerea T4]|uniref:Uncharacterized protein n=1 Tax=Botryotinia fuckeliana (strain T4) TaxID=999810 RepID=G2Y474_BOTF4|nr:hypothetical protein BofuT4_uP006230.1 [Botrytis cinerea T4]